MSIRKVDGIVIDADTWNGENRIGKDKLEIAANKLLQGAGTGVDPTETNPPTGLVSGLIIMWHGTIANIPSGWVICDGNNSTPNLLTRFIEGVATAATDPGAIGGATSKSHVSHKHTMPSHSHTVQTETCTTGSKICGENGPTSSDDPGDTHSTTVSAHSDIRPKYYDIAFLMKT